MDNHVTATLQEFIQTNYLFGDRTRIPSEESSLRETGVLDSTGVLELIEFLEDRYAIEVTEAETVPENLDSIANLTRYVMAKTTGTPIAVTSPGEHS